MNSKTTSLIIHPTITPTLQIPRVGSSDPEANFPTRETGSLGNAPSISPTLLFWRRIIRLLWSDSPTMWVSDYPVTLCFFCFLVSLVQLVAAVSAFLLRLDISTVGWTSRLDGALDVSNVAWTLSKGPKESYKYNLANSLVSLIVLSLDHQNHSK